MYSRLNSCVKYVTLFVLLLLCGCNTDTLIPAEKRSFDRVVIMFVEGHNNLDSYLDHNVVQIGQHVGKHPSTRLVVYQDRNVGSPKLYEVIQDGGVVVRRIIKEYPPENSADPKVLKRVVDEVRSLYQAKSYGLILSSHGTGWLPSNPSLSAGSYSGSERHLPLTKAFGGDNVPVFNQQAETHELAAALPDGVFDYIVFDACYMGGVEVAYEFRKKCDVIIFSPTEVLAEGYPYHLIGGELFSAQPDFVKIGKGIYDYYKDPSRASILRSVVISCVDCSQLEPLAQQVKEIVKQSRASNPSLINSFNLSQVQGFAVRPPECFFDLDHFIEKITSPEQYATFNKQLQRVVIYKAYTDLIFDFYDIRRFGGLSAYIPTNKYPSLNDFYLRNTQWGALVYGRD